MSEIAVFGFGSLMFLMTTWATIAFGVRTVHKLHLEQLEESDGIAEVRDQGLTELHLTEPVARPD